MLVLAPALLAGCSMPSVAMSSTLHAHGSGADRNRDRSNPVAEHATSRSGRHASRANAAPARNTTVTRSPGVVTPASSERYVRGALAAGSTVHRLAMGHRRLVINYWTRQNVGTWTADREVPIYLSAHLEGSPRTTVVRVTRVFATFAPSSTSNVSVLREDDGNFALTQPFSYNSVLLIPAVPNDTRTAQLRIEYDLEIETGADTGEYWRQTELDQLTFDYVADPAAPANQEN